MARCWDELGNSGNSATPHLHLQVQIGRSFLSDGLPFVFDRFQFLGQITDTFWDGDLGLRPNGQLTFAPSPEPGTRRHEMPLNHNVVRFRDAKPGSGGPGGGPRPSARSDVLAGGPWRPARVSPHRPPALCRRLPHAPGRSRTYDTRFRKTLQRLAPSRSAAAARTETPLGDRDHGPSAQGCRRPRSRPVSGVLGDTLGHPPPWAVARRRGPTVRHRHRPRRA